MARRPDYILKALNKDNDKQGVVGAAWVNEGGSIGVVFNPFVVIPNETNIVLTLFPNDKKPDEAPNVVPLKKDTGLPF